MTATLTHSPFRTGRSREQHRKEVRIAAGFLALAYSAGCVSAVSLGLISPLLLGLDLLVISCSLAGCLFAKASNAHHIERGLLLLNLPILVTVAMHALHAGALFYFIPAVVHIAYAERIGAVRAVLVGGYIVGFAFALAHVSTLDGGLPSRAVTMVSVYRDALFSVLFIAYSLRRFRRFNAEARAALSAREAVLEEHVAAWREGREALAREGREIEALAAASRASIRRERAARAQIEAQAEEMRQFAYAASHDLKEPVRTIRSFVQMTRRRLPEDYEVSAEAAEFFAHIDGATAAMGTLLDRLLLYSRAERTPTEAKPTPLPYLLGPLAKSARVTVAPLPDGLGSARPPIARERTAAILGELVDNALCFSGSETGVEVGVRRGRDDELEIFVADRGVGIPADYTERVHGLFQRLHGKAEYPGHGIGLALCRRLLGGEDHRLRLEPRDGGGTVAVLRL